MLGHKNNICNITNTYYFCIALRNSIRVTNRVKNRGGKAMRVQKAKKSERNFQSVLIAILAAKTN
jgi:hypothetical protein